MRFTMFCSINHYVCFDCRLCFKGNTTCPNCHKELVNMGRFFRAPRREAIKAWKNLSERNPRDSWRKKDYGVKIKNNYFKVLEKHENKQKKNAQFKSWAMQVRQACKNINYEYANITRKDLDFLYRTKLAPEKVADFCSKYNHLYLIGKKYYLKTRHSAEYYRALLEYNPPCDEFGQIKMFSQCKL